MQPGTEDRIDNSAPTFEAAVLAPWIARIGLPASLVSALTATILLIGDLAILFFGYVPLSWQLEALRGGTLLALVLGLIGNVATFATFYRWVRIGRHKQKLNLKEEATDQALNAPDYLDHLVPRRRGILRGCQAGCQVFLAVVILLVAAALTTLTFGPGRMRVLAVGPLGPGGRVTAFGAVTATPAPATPTSATPTATAASGVSCHAPTPPAGFSTLTTYQGVCWNYPSTWSPPAANSPEVVAPDAQDYFTVSELNNNAFSSLTFRTVQAGVQLSQQILGSSTHITMNFSNPLPPQTTVTLGSNTWTEQDTTPTYTVTRGGTTFDVTLLLTHHAGANVLVTDIAPRSAASTAFTTFFQPMLQSLTFAS